LITPPADGNALYHWVFFTMVGYLVVVYVSRWVGHRKFCLVPPHQILTRIFDSATFAGSAMLLWGIMDDTILKAIGDTKPFLLVAGLAGLIYSLHAIPPGDAPSNGAVGDYPGGIRGKDAEPVHRKVNQRRSDGVRQAVTHQPIKLRADGDDETAAH